MDYKELIESLNKTCWGESVYMVDTERSKAADTITELSEKVGELETQLAEVKLNRPIELSGQGAESFALAAQLSETQQKLKEVTAERDSYKIFYNDVVSKPDCNTCVRECEYRPSVGKTTRFNCPLWSGNNHER